MYQRKNKRQRRRQKCDQQNQGRQGQRQRQRQADLTACLSPVREDKVYWFPHMLPVYLITLLLFIFDRPGHMQKHSLDPVCLEPVCLEPVCVEPVCLEPVCPEPASGWFISSFKNSLTCFIQVSIGGWGG